ncbi:hypothetical protein DK181_00780 [Streptococcus sobrinus]|nr:hypothetical protein DK181_00780 [Streptococcus sobrinus]
MITTQRVTSKIASLFNKYFTIVLIPLKRTNKRLGKKNHDLHHVETTISPQLLFCLNYFL